MGEVETQHIDDDERDASHLGWALFTVMTLFAFLLGIVGYVVFGGHNTKEKLVASATVEQPTQSIEPASIHLDRQHRAQIIADISLLFGRTTLLSGSKRPVNYTVTNKEQNENPATVSEFFSVIAPSAPKPLVRSLNENYQAGIYSTGNLNGYLIFKSHSYQNSFAGMMRWEPTLAHELLPILLPWSQPEARQMISSNYFVDYKVNNINTRAIRKNRNDTLIIYGFPNRETLLITTNIQTFSALSDEIRSR